MRVREAMVYDIEVAKRLGFNMLRKHIKVEPARWYYHCDRLGMLVWQDMVSGGNVIQIGSARAVKHPESTDVVLHDLHHLIDLKNYPNIQDIAYLMLG